MTIGVEYKNATLNAMLGSNHTDEFPDTLYLALFTSQNTDNGGGTEVTALDYTRKPIANNDTNFPDAAGGIKSLATEVRWSAASEPWGVIGWWALMDDEYDGNVVVHARGGGVSPPLHDAGAQFIIPPYTLQITQADIQE